MLETLEIPNKSMFKLNEVCGLTGVKPYVLRFWESEFTEINPILSSSGQKMYEPKDIEAIATLKQLLFAEKMNIEQAKAELPKRLNPPACDEELPELPQGQANLIESVAPARGMTISRMALSESDIDKLMMAKNLLRSIVS